MTRLPRLPHSSKLTFLLLALTCALSIVCGPAALADPPQALPGLQHPVRVVWDTDGIPHVYAKTDLDAIFMQGYLHAQDRMFWIDVFRRNFEGTLTELVGAPALASDLHFRKFNLQAAAQRSYDASSHKTRRWLQAYADGFNAYMTTHPTPMEYDLLEIDTVRPWRPQDSILMLKGIASLFWVELEDIDRTVTLAKFTEQGEAEGFDGAALYFEDVYRVAPVVPAVVLPNFLNAIGATDSLQSPRVPLRGAAPGVRHAAGIPTPDPRVLQMAEEYWRKLSSLPLVEKTRRDLSFGLGSNWWVISGALSKTGNALFANDPHQPVTMPTILYQTQLTSAEGLDVTGTAFPGLPGIHLGCNQDACWSSTNTNIDAGDVFEEELIFDPATGAPTHTVFQGTPEPIVRVPQQYLANTPGDGIVDNLSVLPVDPLEGDLFLVPRRGNGPLVTFEQTAGSVGVGLSSQWIGWSVAQDLEGYRRLVYVRNVDDFMDAVSYLDNFTYNMGYADRRGHIAYAIGGEAPLRQDLQLSGGVVGQPPILIRDGSGDLPHQWLAEPAPPRNQAVPYKILPRNEMPNVVDPAEGFIITANNDPIGTSVDNDVFDQFRPGGGVLYLHYSYFALRAARIRDEITRRTAHGGKLSMKDLKEIQANNQLFEAQLIVPSLVEAYHNSQLPGAPAALGDLVADPRIGEAIDRLARWNYSTPTGIEEGYDPGDDPDNLQAPSKVEIDNSVAATIYAVWRGQAVRRVIDDTLNRVGLGSLLPDSRTTFRAFVYQVANFNEHHGIGTSGVDFFAVDGVDDRVASRDVVLLDSLRQALDLLASDAFAPAFGGSTNQADYRWGRLHRIRINHVVFPPFSVPNAGGFQDLEPTLPGLARAGGMESVDAATHEVRAADANSFMFTVPPGWRIVAELTRRGPRAEQIVAGGTGGDPFGPRYTNQLGRWLTNQYSPMLTHPGEVNRNAESREIFIPAR